ncbi:malonate--CoA ligase ACSF3, mitochondrial-like [Cylas formicarius]|uniref:malonate--CoA ligase ACSF3, mitochondrial-like n=1 Tax=Cylas formicarius TaxID=197179 RepID=UPI0029583BEA|nr:malonate--CoA ligase ACSF3, mitochondrial-like [Cylas formicarius]
MSHLLRNRRIANYVTQRFQQTQVKVKLNQTPGIVTTGPVFKNAKNFPDKVAIRDRIAGYTYANIFLSANELSKEISSLLGGKTNERVLFLCPNDVHYVITLWAIWMSGQIAIPVSPLHPAGLLMYYANDSSSKLLITVPEFADVMSRVTRNSRSHLHVLDDRLKLNCTMMEASRTSDLEQGGKEDAFYNKSDAMILYTSGTTANPKGVVLSHKNLSAQVGALLNSWKFTPDDVMLHTLPLHHIHGIINALLCPLYAGAKTIMLKKFNANTVWSYLLGVSARPEDRRISLFMGVPTMYFKLIDEYERVFQSDAKMAEYIKNTLRSKIRLMISGSAPLPAPLHHRWEDITGHKLLERYGLTETGMVLSNAYNSDREPGYVGIPLPGVFVKLVEVLDNQEDKYGRTLLECSNLDGTLTFRKLPQKTDKGEDPVGELLVKGAGIFKNYHDRPDSTKNSFTSDGWFKTGDLCQYSLEKKKFKMLGRKNVDIIKSGGHKISALEVEAALLGAPFVRDCSVVGIADKEWGQKVVAIVQIGVTSNGTQPEQAELVAWAEANLPKYAVPKDWRFVDAIPKNYMGKVNKKEVLTLAFGPDHT